MTSYLKTLADVPSYYHQSTVILNANVAFLAIPYVGLTAQAEFPQILSYISTIASVGSITIGLFLVRQLRKSAARSKIPADFVSLCSNVQSIVSSLFTREYKEHVCV